MVQLMDRKVSTQNLIENAEREEFIILEVQFIAQQQRGRLKDYFKLLKEKSNFVIMILNSGE